MGYYSFIAVARQPVAIPDPMVMLDTGRNVFTAQTDDLEAFLKQLVEEGVVVQQVHRLDTFEAVNSEVSLGLPDDLSPQIAPTDETEEP